MAFGAVFLTPQWTLACADQHARIACDLVLVPDEHDDGVYALRLTMNELPVFARVFETVDDAMAEADDALLELLAPGWERATDYSIALVARTHPNRRTVSRTRRTGCSDDRHQSEHVSDASRVRRTRGGISSPSRPRRETPSGMMCTRTSALSRSQNRQIATRDGRMARVNGKIHL
jgi:hypothetical protein